MKKIIAPLIFIICALTGCGDGGVTLESMKNALTDEGYEVYELASLEIENLTGGFIFIYDGAPLPVLEFKDKASAGEYAEYITDDNNFAILNGSFIAIADARYGIAYENEKAFLENLINGREIKSKSVR